MKSKYEWQVQNCIIEYNGVEILFNLMDLGALGDVEL